MRSIFTCALFASLAQAGLLTPVWIELGPNGQVLARVVVDSAADCPVLEADGKPITMTLRAGAPAGFQPACEAAIPQKVRRLRWNSKELPLPKTPRQVIVIGDTGCRVKGSAIQDCDDPAAWPLKAVAAQIASAKPDLVVHVGDYLYRESKCPSPKEGCEGPYGDNWLTWNADFFAPVSTALSAAPWAFSRGNHESCNRAWKGWFYYLYPAEFPASCEDSKPYIARSGQLRIGMLDTGATVDGNEPPAQLQRISADLGTLSGKVDWLADHHPFWGFSPAGGASNAVVTPETLEPAWQQAKPQGIRLILSGHVHLFEFIVGSGQRPNQLIAGDSGTQLDAGISGAAVAAGTVEHDFGFTQMESEHSGWKLTLKNSHGAPLVRCALPDHAPASCTYVSSSSPVSQRGMGRQEVSPGSTTTNLLSAPNQPSRPLTVDQKWQNFASETASPLTLGAGVFNGGASYLTNTDPKYGRNRGGFGEDVAASIADIASQNFFADFLLASAFHEDPRYSRRGPGPSLVDRAEYAISRSVLIRTDTGGTSFNWSNVLGTGMSAALSNAYYPPASRGASSTFTHIGLSIMGTGLAKLAPEFWPDFWQKFAAKHH
ncbi:MAG TPA: metallophosphoesterase [Bryobacteraceae bacterium]|nr:metallophosphoesterase [Bryobacteraceae bacterium]